MTDEPRPLASLSSSLLARRGAARPAMRPQAIRMAHGITSPLEDLGWDDMGDEHALPHQDESATVMRHMPDVEPVPVPSPALHQQEEIARSFAPEPIEPVLEEPRAGEPAPVLRPKAVAAPTVRSAPGKKAKAAFTLRLDEARHLQLRLLCAVQHRSAQHLVTQALDEFLERNKDQLVLPAAASGLNPSTGDRT